MFHHLIRLPVSIPVLCALLADGVADALTRIEYRSLCGDRFRELAKNAKDHRSDRWSQSRGFRRAAAS